METTICTLPGGCIGKDGSVHLQAEIASLSGREEELLAIEQSPNSALTVTSILARCVRRIGGVSPVTEHTVRRLLVADRQYLLLKLRESAFGSRVQASVRCTNQQCTSGIDIDFSIEDIPVTELEDKEPFYRIELSEDAAYRCSCGEVHTNVVFRLPNGEDQETILPLLAHDEVKASEMLLERCVHNICPGGSMVETERLTPLARTEIEQAMEAVAPKVELTMEGDCPECGHEFSVPFDLERFFFNELRTSLDLLYQEVHYLAYHYHWSEREIMEMPKQKRRRYIQVLAGEIERLNDAVQYAY